MQRRHTRSAVRAIAAVTRTSAGRRRGRISNARAATTGEPRCPSRGAGDQGRADQARGEQSRADQARAAQSRADQGRADQARAEQARAEQARAEQARAEQARAAEMQNQRRNAQLAEQQREWQARQAQQQQLERAQRAEQEAQLARRERERQASGAFDRDRDYRPGYEYRYNMGGVFRETNQYGVDVLRQAVNQGYLEGYRAGQIDRRDRVPADFQRAFDFENGNFGYAGSYVPQSDYSYYFAKASNAGTTTAIGAAHDTARLSTGTPRF